ncbi:MAG: hypothetical protein HRU17_10745 [Polyangiaceae bacterium]|nr:hypothetical protein [Polyangiaceae bacterium]
MLKSRTLIVGLIVLGSSCLSVGCDGSDDRKQAAVVDAGSGGGSVEAGGSGGDAVDAGTGGTETDAGDSGEGNAVAFSSTPSMCGLTSDLTTGGAADFAVVPGAGTAPHTFEWDFDGDSVGGAPVPSTDEAPAGVVFETPGIYRVQVTISEEEGRPTTAEVPVTVADAVDSAVVFYGTIESTWFNELFGLSIVKPLTASLVLTTSRPETGSNDVPGVQALA